MPAVCVMRRIYRHAALPHDVEFTSAAWRTMQRFAQNWPWNKEAGGQLFGTISDFRISIEDATPPRRDDVRTRASFVIDSRAAQHEIDERTNRGLVYFGDWHTHPEPEAKPSNEDLKNAARLFRAANGKPFLLMVIVGRHGTYVAVYNSLRVLRLQH